MLIGQSYTYLQKLIQDNYQDQSSKQYKSFQILGLSYLKTITTKLMLFGKNSSKNPYTTIPDLSDEIIKSISIETSKSHVLMCFGKLYINKDINMLNSVQSDLEKLVSLSQNKHILNQSSFNKGINKMKDSSVSSQSTVNMSNNESTMKGYLNSFYGMFKNEKTIPLANSTFKSEQKNITLNNVLKQLNERDDNDNDVHGNISSDIDDNDLDNDDDEDDYQYNKSSMIHGVSSPRPSHLNNPILNQSHHKQVLIYIKNRKDFSTQMQKFSTFKPKNISLKDIPSPSGDKFKHSAKLTIQHYVNNNAPKDYDGLGFGNSKKLARDDCYKQILIKAYNDNKELFKEYVDRNANEGILT